MTTTVFQYTYPEFNNLSGDSASIRDAIGNYINQQYGGSSVSALSSAGPAVSLLAQPPAGTRAPPVPTAAAPAATPTAHAPSQASTATTHHPFASRGGGPHTAANAGPVQGSTQVIQDWTVRIQVKKYELRQTFLVLLFLGEVPADASQWRTCPSFVGIHATFVNSSADQCANCREQADLVTEGFVHLNKKLATVPGLSSFDPSVVSPYLRENLHWRVQTVRLFCVRCFIDALTTLS
jgi:tyrosinase